MKTKSNILLASLMSVVMLVSGCSTAWIDIAIKDLPVVVQIATSILGIVSAAQGKGAIDPAVASEISSVANQVSSDLTDVEALVKSYQAADAASKPGIAGKIDAALSVVSANLTTLLSDAKIKDANTLAAIQGAVALAQITILAIQSLIPSASVSARKAVKPMDPKTLKKQVNQCFAVHGYGQFAIK